MDKILEQICIALEPRIGHDNLLNSLVVGIVVPKLNFLLIMVIADNFGCWVKVVRITVLKHLPNNSGGIFGFMKFVGYLVCKL